MAEVYDGTDTRLNRRVAVKVLRSDLARDPMFLERFRREAQSAAGLNHPNIVAIYDTGEDDIDGVTIPYIVMEFVDGVTLRQLLTTGPRIMPERGLEIIAGTLAALDYAHRHGIIHRDIKPANIMINSHGDAKVMDFGIARAVSDAATSVTATSAVMGTAQYLSPEQARGEVVDARSDIYSAGCVIYELLTGTAPFNGETPVSIAYQHVNEPAKAPSDFDPTIPPALDSIVLHALAKHPSQRYQTAAEFRADVERAIAGMPISAPSALQHTQVIAATTAMPIGNYSNTGLLTTSKVDTNNKKWIFTGIAAVLAGLVMIFAGTQLFGAKTATVSVPELKGMTIAEAAATLENVQLVLGEQTPQADSTAPKGTILSQTPAAGENLQLGQAVNVVVSNGKEQTIVPDLVNLATQDDARIALTDTKLTLGRVDIKDSDKPEGTVISQSIPAATTVDVGTRIDITISSGKLSVPDVVGMTKTQARNELINLGFTVDVVTKEDGTVEPNTVLSQTPAPKSLSKKGTTVTITVSVQPADIECPDGSTVPWDGTCPVVTP